MKFSPSFVRMVVKIHSFFKSFEKASAFLNTENPNLGGSSPVEMVLKGRQEKLEKWVDEMASDHIESRLFEFVNSYMIVPPDHSIGFQGIWIEKRYQEDGKFQWAAFMGRSNSLSKKKKMFLMEGSGVTKDEDISDRRYQSLDDAVTDLQAFMRNEKCSDFYFEYLLNHVQVKFPKSLMNKDAKVRSPSTINPGGSFCPICESFNCRCSGC